MKSFTKLLSFLILTVFTSKTISALPISGTVDLLKASTDPMSSDVSAQDEADTLSTLLTSRSVMVNGRLRRASTNSGSGSLTRLAPNLSSALDVSKLSDDVTGDQENNLPTDILIALIEGVDTSEDAPVPLIDGAKDEVSPAGTADATLKSALQPVAGGITPYARRSPSPSQ